MAMAARAISINQSIDFYFAVGEEEERMEEPVVVYRLLL